MADVDGEPCTINDGISITAEVTSIAHELTITGNVVSETPAVYVVSYQPIKCGRHEISVKVNGTHINTSPFSLLVHNDPHLKKCKAIGEQVVSAQKNNPAKFIVQLADEDGDPCVTKQEVTAELKSLMDGSIINAAIVSQTPDEYEVAYQPSKTGKHTLIVKVNGMEINGSPLAVLVHNIPDPQNCKAVGEGIARAEKHKTLEFMIQLADVEGDPCVTKQEVIVELESIVDGSLTKADVVSKTPATYAVSYQPSKIGRNKLSMKVNGMEINGSPFALLVHNIPDPQNCKAVGEGISKAMKQKTSEFMVELADAEGDPCVTQQQVVVELQSLVDGSITKANVVSKTPATYAVSYQPSKIGEHELSVKVNSVHIHGSQFAVLVYNIPDPWNCKAVGIVKTVKKYKNFNFIVQLADEEGHPCITEQEVTAELKSLANGSYTKANVVSQTPATYEVAYQPSKTGKHTLSVRVNGVEINGSPFTFLVYNIPDPQNCKAVGKGITRAEKHKTSKFIVQLADAEGDPCVTEQEVVVELKSLVDGSITKGNVVWIFSATYAVSYQPSKIGEHELSVKVNGVHINDSLFAVFVDNIPDPQNCKAVGIVKTVRKHSNFKFNVELADAEGEPFITGQDVIAQLISTDDHHYSFNASVTHMSKDIYEVSYRPRKSAEYKLIVKVNGREINSSPFHLLVYNTPHPQNCEVKIVSYVLPAVVCELEYVYGYFTVPGMVKLDCDSRQMHPLPQQQQRIHHSIIVELADKDGEPCITTQKVTATMEDEHSLHRCKVHSEDSATYRVDKPNCPIGRYILTAYVNGMAISNPLHINLGELNWH